MFVTPRQPPITTASILGVEETRRFVGNREGGERATGQIASQVLPLLAPPSHLAGIYTAPHRWLQGICFSPS